MPLSTDDVYGSVKETLPAQLIPASTVLTEPSRSSEAQRQFNISEVKREMRRRDVGPMQMGFLQEELDKLQVKSPTRVARTGGGGGGLLKAGFTTDEVYSPHEDSSLVNTPVSRALGVLKQAGGEAAALADLVLSMPGLILKDRKSTRLNSSHIQKSRMPSSA